MYRFLIATLLVCFSFVSHASEELSHPKEYGKDFKPDALYKSIQGLRPKLKIEFSFFNDELKLKIRRKKFAFLYKKRNHNFNFDIKRNREYLLQYNFKF